MGIIKQYDADRLAVSVREAKLQVELPAASTSHDVHLERLIRSAIHQIEQRCDRSLIEQTFVLSLNRFPCWELKLPAPPLKRVESIEYVDNCGEKQVLDPSEYIVGTNSRPGMITPSYNNYWPYARNQIESVKIRYVAGFGKDPCDVPSEYKLAILLAVDQWFDPDSATGRKDSVGLPAAAMEIIESMHSGMKYGQYGVTN